MKNGKGAVFIIPVKHSSAVRDDCCTRVRAALGGGHGLFTLCNHTAFGVLVDVLLRPKLHACVRALISLHVCMNYLRVHLWAAGWVCSLKRVRFCCHFFLSLSLGSILTLRFSFSCGCVIHCPPAPPLVFHYPCLIVIDFKGQGKMMEECLSPTLPHPEPYATEEGSW